MKTVTFWKTISATGRVSYWKRFDDIGKTHRMCKAEYDRIRALYTQELEQMREDIKELSKQLNIEIHGINGL